MTNPVPPVASFTGIPISGNKPLTVQFTDTSTNFPTSWSWTFGDGGTSTAQSPSYTYANNGTYTVTLIATNALGSNTLTKPSYITVTSPAPPVASFTGTPTSGTRPLTVQFTDASSNSPTSWSWTFGDGNTSNVQNPPPHTYVSAGTYNVTLTVTNALGSNTLPRTNYITVTNPAPTVTEITPNNGTRGNSVPITNLVGTNFVTGATILFSTDTSTGNAIYLTNVSVVSSTKITGTLVIPNGQQRTTYYVRVTNTDGQTGISSSQIFTVN